MMFWKVLFMWPSMPSFTFIGYTLTELFRKSDNWRQMYKQTSSTFCTSNDVSRRKNYWYVMTRLRNSFLFTFKKKIQNQPSQVQKQSWEVFRSLFLIKFQILSLQIFSKETPTQVLSCEVWETFKNTYFEENMQATPFGGVL